MPYFFWNLLFLFLPLTLFASPIEEFAVLYKGRFRPAEAYARLWLYENYHAQSLRTKDLQLFDQPNRPALFTFAGRIKVNKADRSALDFLLHLHVFGYKSFETAPLFWIQSAEVKKIAHLNLLKDRFSYQELREAFYHNAQSSTKIIQLLATYEFWQAYLSPLNLSLSERFELTQLMPGFWVQLNDQSDLFAISVPPHFPWPLLKKGQLIDRTGQDQATSFLKQNKRIVDSLFSLMSALRQFEMINGPVLPFEEAYASHLATLFSQNLPPKRIAAALEKNYPLSERLKSAGSLFKALPNPHQEDWYSLHALKIKVYAPAQNQLMPVGNFTSFSDDRFEKIRHSYIVWERAVLEQQEDAVQKKWLNELGEALTNAYSELGGTIFQKADDKAILYPTSNQLHFESLYYQFPWIEYLILLYAISAIALLCAYQLPHLFLRKFALGTLGVAFACHTLLLLWRSYLLNRPPVSNMFETVIYVPWMAVFGGLLLNTYCRHLLILIAGALSSIILLVILQLADLNQGLDNVQAVLDSKFWLLIHVLMVVGSYGIFILGAILGHFYLGLFLYHRTETPTMAYLSKCILQTMYLGLALLIPGTLLGGVWAAESWGRFWDWDPKESWAFISICLYLIWVHAYRFHRIASFGLAIGAVSGLLAISFTWYGVNYILGTGLHSYGFGSGGELYYYLFLGAEATFLVSALWVFPQHSNN
ncbi:MAG: cytochrome c biogenesis protein [Chlamydiales bacterium]